MTLTELKYIVALAQEKHFGHAASQCRVSQPTLSVAIRKLEDRLKVAIFERNKQGVTVTPIGEQIVAQANRVLEESAKIDDIALAGKNQLATPLRLGVIFTIGPYLLPHIIPQLRRNTPAMPLMIDENFTGHEVVDDVVFAQQDMCSLVESHMVCAIAPIVRPFRCSLHVLFQGMQFAQIDVVFTALDRVELCGPGQVVHFRGRAQ